MSRQSKQPPLAAKLLRAVDVCLRERLVVILLLGLAAVGGMFGPVGMVGAADMPVLTANETLLKPDIRHLPWSDLFWIERKAGKYRTGDASSFFSGNTNYENLTFDISNNKILANVGVQGELKIVTIYGRSAPITGQIKNRGGVWMTKEIKSSGPYSYSVEVDGRTNDLAQVNWDFRTGLLDNIFPVTELQAPQGRYTIRLLTYAPISTDGSQRLRGVIYGLELKNDSASTLQGTVYLPKLADHPEAMNKIDEMEFNPATFKIDLADGRPGQRGKAFHLKPGETVWVPAVIYTPEEPILDAIQARGSLAWLGESWNYYRNILGRLTTPDDPFSGEFYERQIMGALQSIAMSDDGAIAGSNNGSYPPSLEIWSKDCSYACLPFMSHDPLLAQKMILWFNEFGVRPKDSRFESGANHSLEVSVASLLLAGAYYDQTGDKTFFRRHAELKTAWGKLLDDIAASRADPDIWLFPSHYVSDGRIEGDYHIGSNICVWRALHAYGRLLREVFHDDVAAAKRDAQAGKVGLAILQKGVVPGPYGAQFTEATWRDGRPPKLIGDGEESDMTLMPFYGFLAYDNAIYLNAMRFQVSTNNPNYNPSLHGVKWRTTVPITVPAYIKSVCYGSNYDSLLGEQGRLTEIRRLTDADGSLRWWPYGGKSIENGGVDPANPQYGRVTRATGKSGWFAGVYSTIFTSRLLGIRYDAPTATLNFEPLPTMGDFSWINFPFGTDRFSIVVKRQSNSRTVLIKNPNPHSTTARITLALDKENDALSVKIGGKSVPLMRTTTYFNYKAMSFETTLPPNGIQEIQIAARDETTAQK